MVDNDGRFGLVTGATGFVGGRVTQELLDRGWRVRVLSRSADKVRALEWGSACVADGAVAGPGQVEIVEGDADDAAALASALEGIDVAWYLLHSMGEGDDFAREEEQMAERFATAAREAGVSRIVYLGGLHPERGELSEHLASRVRVGEVLLASGVPTAALQAGVVLGDESSSFSMLRHLAERLPGAIAPAWVRNKIQPIAVDDAVHYLVGAADLGPEHNRTFDIGGPEALEYAAMMDQYARAMGRLPRLVLTAPVTTPKLAARWIGLVTPVSSALATPLIGSLLHDTVVHERDLDELVGPPPGGHTPFADAVREAAAGQDTGRWLRTLGACGAAVAATAVLGSLASAPGSRWYKTLNKPAWQPPGWVFPVVWNLLYADIALVSALTLADAAELERDEDRRGYATALAVNLVLNAGWSWMFFNRHWLRRSIAGAAALAVSSGDLVRRAGSVAPEKGAVLAPYAAWTAFATVLSASIAARNPRR